MKVMSGAFRLAVVYICVKVPLYALFDPDSTVSETVVKQGGLFWMWGLLALCALVAADAIVNDIVPGFVRAVPQSPAPILRVPRMYALMTIAAAHMSIVLMMSHVAPSAILWNLFGNVCFASCAAYLDLRERVVIPRRLEAQCVIPLQRTTRR